MKKILLTGGGTAGHVTPNMALIPRLKELNYEIKYIGSYTGIERKLIEEIDIPYYGISSGKLRRYLSVRNITDPFRIIKGYSEAKKIVKEYRPDILFSKGGFVSVPVVMAAKKYNIPIIIHESDISPGLANRLSIPYSTKICHNFPETSKFLPADKAVLTGSPIRRELMQGNKLVGLKLCGFTANKQVIMVIGGSLGSAAINASVRLALPELLKEYQVVHLCGKGKINSSMENLIGYKQFEYIKGELKDLFAMSDLVISRAGANAICEILALKKPSILIPLSAKASRGDQLLNAQSFKNQGLSEVIYEENLTKDTLIDTIKYTLNNKNTYLEAIEKTTHQDAIETIISLIQDYS